MTRGARGRPSRPPRGVSLVAAYAGFAAVATLANLAAQVATLAIYQGPYKLWSAMAVGTVAGLVPKYVLDKRWIFDDRATGLSAHAQRFTTYTLLSVATTGIFWATELLFSRLGGHWYLVGAVLGLGLGYWVKFHLDRRFTFGSAGCN